jgi:hypothetical protein
MEYTELRDYIITLDDADHKMIDQRVAEKGIEGYLNQQLIYLDCSRIIQGMRMMQTIGYPYQREISSYLYALSGLAEDPSYEQEWLNKLLECHQANLEYEKENPPIWYGGKKAKDKWDKEHGKHPRRKKVSEQTIPGMGKEISNKERLKKLSAQFGNLTFKIKPPKKD